MSWANEDQRWRTAPPVSRYVGGAIVDGYGFKWCRRGLHLLDERTLTPNGSCRPCENIRQRQRRGRKR